MIQMQVLNRVLTDKNISLLVNNGIDGEYFNQYPDEYKFIVEHYREYGNTPDDASMQSKFPNFPLYDVEESPKYLIQTLKEDRLYHLTGPILMEASELMKTDTEAAIQFMLPRVQKLLTENISIHAKDIMAYALERYEMMMEKKESDEPIGISSGMEEIDEVIGGWMPGEELVTIVGRINQGKSWILLYFLAKAWESGSKILLYSGEMGYSQVGYRVDTLLAHYSNRGLTRGIVNDIVADKYKESLTEFSESGVPFHVVTPKDLGNKKLTVSMLQQLIEAYKPDIIGIDQISLMEDERRQRGDSTRIQYTHIAEDLFALSEKYSLPILVDAQANRLAAAKDVHEMQPPEIHEIGESDGIGAFSSRIISLVQTPSGLKLKVIKNRHGANNVAFTYCWDIDTGTFDYLPVVGEDELGKVDVDVRDKLRSKNETLASQQRSKFKTGVEAF